MAPGVDLRAWALRRAWLPGANLSGSDLRGADLAGANLAGADLTGAKLGGADLRDADLRGACLVNTDLSEAVLDRVMMVGAKLDGASFERARLWGADCSLVQGENVSFAQAQVDGACFESADLPSSCWDGALGRDVVLRGARLDGASLADVQWVRPNLRLATLAGATFEGAGLARARLERADCTGACFDRAMLAGVRLRGATLDDATFDGAVAAGVRLRGIPLSLLQREVLWAGGAVGGEPAPEEEREDSQVSSADLGPQTALGRGWSAISALSDRMAAAITRAALEEVVPGAELSGRDYAGYSFGGRDLRGVCLNGARLVGADFSGCDLRDALFEEADLTGAVLDRADLTNARLVRARLESAVLTDARLSAASFRSADLRRADLTQAVAEGADFSGARFLGARLDAVDFSNAKLVDADLRGASVREASFQGADVHGARVSGAVGFVGSPEAALIGQGALGGDALAPALTARMARVGQRLLLVWLASLRAISSGGAALRRLAVVAFQGVIEVWNRAADAWARRSTLSSVRRAELVQEARLQQEALEAERAAQRAVDVAEAERIAEKEIEEAATAAIRYPTADEGYDEQALVGTALFSLVALSVIVLLVFFGNLPDRVTDQRLETEAIEAVEAGEALRAAQRYADLAERSLTDGLRATWLLEQARALSEAQTQATDTQALFSRSEWRPPEEVLEAALPLADTADLAHRIRLRLAVLYGEQGREEDARQVLEAVLDDAKAGPEKWAGALIVSRGLGFEPDLTAVFQSLASGRMRNNPDSLVAVLARVADHVVAEGNQAELLTAMSGLEPENWPPYEQARFQVVLARSKDALGDREGALSAFDAALALLPEDGVSGVAVRFEIARLRAGLGAFDETLVALRPLLAESVSPEWRARAQLLSAQAERGRGEYDVSERVYRSVLADWPADSEWAAAARRGLGQIAYAQGELSALMARLDGAVLDADAPDVIVGAAGALLEAERPAEALELLEALLKQLPEGMPVRIAARSLRAQAFVDAQMLPEAIEALRGLQAESEGEMRLAYDVRIAEALYTTGRLDEAGGAFSSILEVASGQTVFAAKLGLARIAEARGHTEQALGIYAAVAGDVSASALRAEAFEGMAGIHLESGRLTEALISYRDFVAELPDGHWARIGAAQSMAEILVSRGAFAAAIPILADALVMDPTSGRGPFLQTLLAQSLLGVGRLDEAERLWEELALADTPQELREDIEIGKVATAVAQERHDQVLALTEEVVWSEGQEGVRILLEHRLASLRALERVDEAGRLAATLETPQNAVSAAIDRQLEDMRGHMAAGRHEQASALLESLRSVVVDLPTLAEIDRERATVYAAQGDREAARKLLEASLTQYAAIDEAVFAAGLALAALDAADGESEAALTRLGALSPPDAGHRAWWFDAQARVHWGAGDPDAAASEWRALLDEDLGAEGSSAAHIGLGELALADGRLDEAATAFERAVRVSADVGTVAFARLRLAQAQSAAGRHTVAVTMLRQLLEGSIDRELKIQAELALASELQEIGDWSGSAQRATSADTSGLDPAYSVQATQIASAAYLELEDYARALLLFEALEAAHPRNEEVRFVSTFGRAKLAAQTGKIDEAVGLFQALFDRAEERYRQAEVLLGWARALEDANRDAGAQVLYRRIDAEYGDEQEIVGPARAALKENDD